MSFVSSHISSHELTFSCYSAATRDNFLTTRLRRPEMRQRGLVAVHKVQSSNTGLVYICSVQCEEQLKSLEEETLDRRRAGRGWSEEEVKQMLVDLSAGLAYAQSWEMYASDLSPRNVMFTEEEFKLLDLHESAGVSVNIHPAFLFPEWKEDQSRASVRSLSLLALWMLQPDCENIELPARLEPLLIPMLSEQPPDPVSLALLVQEVWGESPLQAFHAALEVQAFEPAKLLLSRLLNTPLNVSMTFSCSGCSVPVPLPCGVGVMSVCKHHLTCGLFCLVQASNSRGVTVASRCPFCDLPSPKAVLQKRALCETCGHQFTVGQEAWRLQLLGSPDYNEAQNYCSEACFYHSSPHVDYEIPDKQWESIYLIIETVSLILKPVQTEFLGQVMFKGIFQELSTHLAREFQKAVLTCHFCDQTLESLEESRWIWCAKGLRIACSTLCLRGFLEIRDETQVSSRRCPTCCESVSAARIKETLSLKSLLDLPLRNYCVRCGLQHTTVLQCSHTYCADHEMTQCDYCEFLKTLRTDFERQFSQQA